MQILLHKHLNSHSSQSSLPSEVYFGQASRNTVYFLQFYRFWSQDPFTSEDTKNSTNYKFNSTNINISYQCEQRQQMISFFCFLLLLLLLLK